MKPVLLSVIFFMFLVMNAFPQVEVQKAYLDKDGRVLTKSFQAHHLDPMAGLLDDTYVQPEPWPIKVAASPSFKNFRGVTLADIDGDGVEDILVASFNQLHVFKGNGELIWSFTLTGTATYPPSVADVTGDGNLEIVQLTGGIPNNGRAYLFNRDGEVMSGWPLNFNNNWILSAPALADLDGNGQMEIVFGVRTLNEMHVVKADGSPFNENWPVELSGIPAFTPSIGDIDGDGELDIIASASNGTLYAFDLNAQTKPGFPVQAPSTGFSYQSPLLVDFEADGKLSIVGATHGDAPEYYIREHDGTYRDGWPVPVPGGGWTYHPPTVVDINEDDNFEIFTAKPVGQDPAPMLFGFDEAGEMLGNFPVTKAGGLEGFLSVADIDGDGNLDLIFGSNLMVEGQGFIHAYKTDGSGEIEGFPLRPGGFTFMNGANLGDVTGDGNLNLVALSYELTFSPEDSTLINVYDMGISMADAKVRFATYKGSNTRTGLVVPYEEPDTQYITAVQPLDDITVPLGTPEEELELPDFVQVELDNDPEDTALVPLTWVPGDPEYDETTTGTYPFTGYLDPTGWIQNPDELTASVDVIVVDDPGPMWTFLRMVNASNDLGNVHVFLNDELLLENFSTGMTSDTFHIQIYIPYTIDLVDPDNDEVILSYSFELDINPPDAYYDDCSGKLIVLAGHLDENGNEEYFLDFHSGNINACATDTAAYIVNFFYAFANPDAETDYTITTLTNDDWPDEQPEIEYGQFSQAIFHSADLFEVALSVEVEEPFYYLNSIDFSEFYEWGSPGIIMVILDFWPGNEDPAPGLPYFLLMPPDGGMLIEPEFYMDINAIEDVSSLSLVQKLYPNPASESFTISFNIPEPGNLMVEVLDLTGRKWLVQEESVNQSGPFDMVLSSGSLKQGVYFVRCQLGNQQLTIPLLIKR